MTMRYCTYWEQTVVFCDFFQFYVLWGFYSPHLKPPSCFFFVFWHAVCAGRQSSPGMWLVIMSWTEVL